MSEASSEMTTGAHRTQDPSSAAALASPLDNDDILAGILRRLPPRPSSLARASLVCKQWRRVISDPHFVSSLHAHHRKPPLLGFIRYTHRYGNMDFTPVLDPPDRVPAARFSLRAHGPSEILRCRHGRLLILNRKLKHLLVWDPMAGELRQVPLPQALHRNVNPLPINGALVCASTDEGHVHGACGSEPFKVVLVGENNDGFFACVYASETGTWGDHFSLARPPVVLTVHPTAPSTQFNNSMCLLLFGVDVAILEVDWGRRNLAVIDAPSDVHDLLDAFVRGHCQFLTTAPAESSGGLSFICLADFSVRVWKRTSSGSSGSVAGWTLGSTIDLSNLLSLTPTILSPMPLKILGLDEYNNVMLEMRDQGAVFSVHLESLQFKEFHPQSFANDWGHPFTSYYTPGTQANTIQGA